MDFRLFFSLSLVEYVPFVGPIGGAEANSRDR